MGKWHHSNNFLVNLSIKWKISLVVVPLLLLMGLANIVAIERQLADAFYHELLEDSYSIGNAISSGVSSHLLADDQKTVKEIFNNNINLERDLVYLYVTGADGRVIVHSFGQVFPEGIRKRANISETEDPSHRIVHLPEGDIHEMHIALRDGALGVLHVGMSAAALNEPQARARNNLLAITLLVTLLGLVVLMFMIRLITKPVADLAGAAEALGRDELDVKLATSDDEIGQLARAFNRMATEMRANQARREVAERAKGESEELYRSLVDNINLGVTMISKDFEVLVANAAIGRMFNRTPESLLDLKCHRVFEKREEICSHCPGAKAMRSGRSEETETTGTRDDGSTFRVLVRAFPVRNEQQEITGFIEIVSDITEEKSKAEVLQRIKNIEAIGQLAGGLAHDFNNLLTAIIGNIELARIGIEPGQNAALRLDAAGKACEQARTLTRQLLTFAKGGAPLKKLVRLPPILDEACHFSLSGSSLHYILDAPEKLWPVEIDSSQFNQVIHSLLSNARAAMSANPTGKIFVVAENVELEEETRPSLPSGRYVKIVIADEGSGISPEVLRNLFSPYPTGREIGAQEGLGLGLAICYSVIHKHGGLLTAESKEMGGATFTIYLPAGAKTSAGSPLAQMIPGGASSLTTPASLRILILEDEEEVARIATSFLATQHHQGEVATTGRQAVKLFQEAQTTDQPFDLLILDLTIRGGMGGEEVLKKIRESVPDIPAIVTSGYTDDPVMTDCRSHGFQSALPKPFNQVTLRAAIAEAIAVAEPGRAVKD